MDEKLLKIIGQLYVSYHDNANIIKQAQDIIQQLTAAAGSHDATGVNAYIVLQLAAEPGLARVRVDMPFLVL